MPLRWFLDTCFCILDIDDNFNLIRVEQKCELHKDIPDQAILNVVHVFNKSFNDRLPENPTKEQILELQLEKNNEKKTTRRKT